MTASKKAPNQRQQPQKQIPRPPGLPSGKGRSSPSASTGNALQRYDARSLGHLPGPRASAPYTVVRERITFTVSSSTNGNNEVVLFGQFVQGAFGTSGGEHLSPVVAVSGRGAIVPGSSNEVQQTSRLFGGVAPMTKSCAMHSFSVEVACTGSESGVLPSGNVWAGAITQPFNRLSGWTDFNSIALGLQTRRSMKMFSSYETMTKPVDVISYPLDPVAHSEFLWMSGAAAATDELSRSMTPIAVIIGPSAARNDYTISLTIEWRMREAIDPIIQSTHQQHMPVAESVWSQLSAQLSNAGGFLKHAALGYGAQAAVRGAVRVGARMAPRVLATLP